MSSNRKFHSLPTRGLNLSVVGEILLNEERTSEVTEDEQRLLAESKPSTDQRNQGATKGANRPATIVYPTTGQTNYATTKAVVEPSNDEDAYGGRKGAHRPASVVYPTTGQTNAATKDANSPAATDYPSTGQADYRGTKEPSSSAHQSLAVAASRVMTISLLKILQVEKSISSPIDIVCLGNSFIFTDKKGNRIGKIDDGGSITLLCWGKDGLPKTASEMQPHGITAISKEEPIFLFTDYKNGCILKYDKQRESCHMWNKGVSRLTQPTGICHDGKGNVYVADQHDGSHGSIHVFNEYGKHKEQFGEQHLTKPGLLAMNSKDEIYVVEETGIYVFTCQGNYLYKIKMANRRSCHGVAFDAQDNVFISTRSPSTMGSTSNEAVQVFNPKHEPVITVGGPRSFNKIAGLCVYNNKLAVADGGNRRIITYRITYGNDNESYLIPSLVTADDCANYNGKY